MTTNTENNTGIDSIDAMVTNIIKGNPEQAQVHFHDYLVTKVGQMLNTDQNPLNDSKDINEE